LVKIQRRNDCGWLQRKQDASRRHAVGEAEEEEQGRSHGWPTGAAGMPHADVVGLRNAKSYTLRLTKGSERGRVE
jgi:hypothetical protein